jgi:hypothetical protein
MSNTTSERKRIISSCQHCKFAVTVDNTQTGCQFNVTDKLQAVEAYNEESNFFVIPDFICQFHRDKKTKDTKEEVREFVKPTYDIILLGTSKDSVLAALNKIKECENQPKYIKVVLDAADIVWEREILDLLGTCGFKYKICYLIEAKPSLDDADLYMQETNSSSSWYQCYIDSEYSNTDIVVVDQVLNEEIQVRCLFKKQNSFTIMRHIHNAIGSCRNLNVIPAELCYMI